MAEKKKEKIKAKKATPSAKKTVKKSVKVKAAPKEKTTQTGIKKEYLEGKNVCRTTFRLPKVAAPDAKTVSIVGDFNNWNIHANHMKKMKNGDYAISIDLEPGREYQFRYLIDETRWENDWNADRYEPSPHGNCDNSIVVV